MKAEPVPALQPVFLALLPGALVLTGWHGAGVVLNLIGVGAGTAIALLLLPPGTQPRWQRLRNQPGAWLAALLLGLALPPALPLWLGVAGGAVTVAARQSRIVAANPAMLAYALLLLAFPLAMSRWPLAGAAPAELQESLRAVLGLLPEQRLDALSGATALEQLRADTAHTVAELRAKEPAFGTWGARGIEWANAAFLAGGLWLAWRGLVAWRLPASMLGTLFLLALFGNDGGSSASRGPALFHLFSGGTMLAAFFVLTEPRGAPRSALGQWLGGALAGALVYAMRTSGAWPDGIAFAVLTLNAVAPVLDWPKPLLNAPQAGAQSSARALPGLARAAVLLLALAPVWREPAMSRASAADPLAWMASLDTLQGAEIRAFPVQDAMRLGLGETDTAYRAIRDGRVQGVLLPLVAPQGYGGPIRLWLALDPAGRVLGVRVIAHGESPAFTEPQLTATDGWLARFRGRGLADTRWRLRREGGDFDAFTGASITPRAVVAGLEGGLQYFRENRERLLDPTR